MFKLSDGSETKYNFTLNYYAELDTTLSVDTTFKGCHEKTSNCCFTLIQLIVLYISKYTQKNN